MKLKRLLLLIAVPLLLSTGAGAQLAKFQALFLFQFAKNTSWPTEDAGKPFQFTIISDNAVAQELRQLVANKSLGQRAIQVVETTQTGDLAKCDIIYVGKSQSKQLGKLVAQYAGKKVLIVSGMGGMCSTGASISFVPEGGKLNFEISEGNIGKNGLKVTPKLLSLGRKV